MKVQVTLLFASLLLISGCSSSLWVKYKINSSLTEMKSANQGQLKLMDSTWQMVKSNSQSKILRTDNKPEVLNFCTCKMDGDTLKITAFELTRKGASPEVSVFKNKFKTSTTFYVGNDIEHKDKYELRVASVNQLLQLNRANLAKGVQVIGYLEMQSKAFQHYDLTSAVEFRGQFQCVIE